MNHLSVGVCLLGCSSALPMSAPSPVLNQAIEFSLPSDRGSLVSIPLTGAATTVIDAWAPSCAPCRQKLPALHARKAELEARGAKLILIAVLADSESTDDARAALSRWGIDAPFLVDRGDVMRREAGVAAVPETLLLDAHGVVRWVAPADATAEQVVSAVAALR
ncbi:MAG TPA: TlpA disulfide reductase family protein [Polyangiaceae bacterium]|nr:TlpA disulfide reductase family protein [Polyangiaceae bacterium]